MLLYAIALFASVDNQANEAKATAATTTWKNCLAAGVRKYGQAKSEPIETLAIAVMTSCRVEESAAVEAWQPITALWAKEHVVELNQVDMDIMKSRLRELVVTALLDMRLPSPAK